ncbi:hypothetical protein Mithridates_00165 [Acinetobacter phage Mithridates]|nr:hypothetical protein Mithridates_00165 [Acinetobacter phage Mithridates]
MVAIPKDKFPIGCKVRVISGECRWKIGDIGKVIGYGCGDIVVYNPRIEGHNAETYCFDKNGCRIKDEVRLKYAGHLWYISVRRVERIGG